MLIGAGGDIPAGDVQVLAAPSYLEAAITGRASGFAEAAAPPPIFAEPEAQTAATVTLTVIRQMERELPNLDALKSPDVQARIAARVGAITGPVQGELEGIRATPDIGKIVATVAERVAAQTIEIPEIVVLPTSDVTFRFERSIWRTSTDRLPAARERDHLAGAAHGAATLNRGRHGRAPTGAAGRLSGQPPDRL